MSRPLTMTQTAFEVGLSRERFRKVWQAWTRDRAFPRPIRGAEHVGSGRRGDAYAWDPEAVAAWKAARQRCGVPVAGDPANENPTPQQLAQVRAPRLVRARDHLHQLMHREA